MASLWLLCPPASPDTCMFVYVVTSMTVDVMYDMLGEVPAPREWLHTDLRQVLLASEMDCIVGLF